MFRNMRLGAKLGCGFGGILVLLTIVAGIYQYAVSSATGGFERLMKEEVAIKDLAASAESLMLQCRRHEKDFLIRKDKEYAKKLDKTVAALTGDLQGIVKLSKDINRDELAAKASAAVENANSYAGGFRELVAEWEKRGLDHNSGLQGQFRNVAHEMEKEIAASEMGENVQVLLLQVRRDEKDYLLRGNEEYVKKTHGSLARMVIGVEKSGASVDIVKKIKKSVESYKSVFDAAVEQDKKIDSVEAKMRDAVHRIEPAVDEIANLAGRFAISKTKETSDRANSQGLLAIVLSGVAVVIGILFSVFLTRGVTVPIRGAVSTLDLLAQGDLSMEIAVESKDETGQLQSSMKSMVSNLKGTVGLAGEIAKGNTSVEVKLLSEKDELGKALEGMVGNLRETSLLAGEIAKGNLSVSVELRSEKDELGRALKSMVGNLKATSDLAGEIAKGNLGVEVKLLSEKDELGRALSLMVGKLREIVLEVKAAGDNVASASEQMGSSSEEMSQGATEQAASAEEASSSMEEMAANIRQNADNAAQTEKIALKSAEDAREGGKATWTSTNTRASSCSRV